MRCVRSVSTLALASAVLLCACAASPPATPPSDAPAPQASAPTALASPAVSPTASAAPVNGASPPPSGLPSPVASAQTGAAFALPAQVVALRLGTVDRFLEQQGETVQLEAVFVDRNGQAVAVPEAPLVWRSSRPQDFSVSATGQVTALVSAGFSVIEVTLPASDLSARVVLNVAGAGSTGGSGGGGSGPAGNTPPEITSLSASATTVTGAGVLVRLDATGRDAESALSTQQFIWACNAENCNTFSSTTGTQVYWRSPAQAGSYSLELTLTDGESITRETLVITVSGGEGTVVVNAPP